MQEFSELYKRLELAPLRIQYKDYAAWQETFKTSDIYKRQESYWLKQLAGELPVLELPLPGAAVCPSAIRALAAHRPVV